MGELAARTIFSNDTGPLAGTGLDTLAKNQGAILELEGAQAPQSKTITDGRISPTAAYVIVDTEGGAAADDLDVINPVISASENLHDGMIVYLRAADSGRVVTVKNSSSANGINTYNGSDYILSTTHWLKLQLRSGKWYEVEGRAMETALAAKAAASTPATTTSRGIGRVATLAEALPGSTITNGPAFLDAETVKITPTPTANAVPQADAEGKIPEWAFETGDLLASCRGSKTGFLLCNGGAYSRTTYANLFSLLGTAFGAGNGSTTFNVPDFRGRTIQGAKANLMAVLAAGLPELFGEVGRTKWVGGSFATGVFSLHTPTHEQWMTGSIYNADQMILRFKASDYNPMFGASDTVQSPAIAANIFIKF